MLKKVISVILCAIMVLSLCACSPAVSNGGAGQNPSGLQVGYARENITPAESVPMGGYGNPDKRFSTGYLDYLYATCIAITGTNGETVLLYTLDLINGGSSSLTGEWAKAVEEKTGVPASHIQFHGTHSHSTPSLGDTEYPAVTNYLKLLAEKIVLAAENALADRAESKMFISRTDISGMNFVRHYLLDNNTYAGSNFGDFSSGEIVDHSEKNDGNMQILKFDRVDEAKKDIFMMNWGAHPCFTGGMTEYNISADFISSARDYVEKQTGGLFAYFTGAAGNQNARSQIDAEKHGLDKTSYGEKLGSYYMDALQNLTPVEGTEVQAMKKIYEGKVNHEGEELLDKAREVSGFFKETGDRSAGNKIAQEYGMSSVYHANAIISRSGMPATRNLELNAISVGNLSFIGAPYEMFAQSSIDIKAGTPFDMTFIMTMQHGHDGYIPTQIAYDYGCYESHTGKYAPGTAELLVDVYLDMLKTLKETAK